MTTLQAWQHIYSNVEKEQSPQGRGGFQTLFYTQSALSETEVEEMEGRLLYFASDIEPVKRVFFSLTSGKRVVAQLVPLSETDQYGRGGRYLAHSLIFSEDTFSRFSEDPFPVFRNAPFISTVKDALSQGNLQNGHIDPITFEATVDNTQSVRLAATWNQSELKKLEPAGTAGQSDGPGKTGRSPDGATRSGGASHTSRLFRAANRTTPGLHLRHLFLSLQSGGHLLLGRRISGTNRQSNL